MFVVSFLLFTLANIPFDEVMSGFIISTDQISDEPSFF